MAFANFCVKSVLSASSHDIEPSKIKVSIIIEEEGYTMHQLSNCDETGLKWKILHATLADGSGRCARSFKVSKEKLLFLLNMLILQVTSAYHYSCHS